MQHDPVSAKPTQGVVSGIGLVIGAAICGLVFTQIRSHDTHASFYYLLLLYAVLLPVTIFYLRGGKTNISAPPYQLPPIHLVIGAAALIAILFISWSLANGRLFGDEYAYRFQARIFASGKIAAPPMPGANADAAARPPEIYFEHTIQAPWGWFSKYPPGWPLALSVGYLLHIHWLMNPLFAVVQLACVWYLARPFGRMCQVLAITFVASSVYFLMWSIGFMSHACEATAALLALICVLKSARLSSLRWLAGSFALVFAATLVRPYTGAVIGAVCAAIALFAFRGRARLLIEACAVIAVAAILSGAAVLLQNWTYTGDMFLSPYAALHGGRDVQEVTLSVKGILQNIAQTTRWEITDTIRSTFPFLFVLAIYAVIAEKKYRFEVNSLALLFPALILAHMIKTEPSGSYNGNRLYYEGFGAISIVAARGCQLLLQHWRVSQPRVLTVLSVMLVLQVLNCVLGMKDAMWAGQPYVAMYDYAHRQLHAPLVFIQDSSPVFTAKHTNWNDIQWRSSPTVYLMDPGPARRDEVACRFDRPEWSVINYDPATRTISSFNGKSVCVGQTSSPVPRLGITLSPSPANYRLPIQSRRLSTSRRDSTGYDPIALGP